MCTHFWKWLRCYNFTPFKNHFVTQVYFDIKHGICTEAVSVILYRLKHIFILQLIHIDNRYIWWIKKLQLLENPLLLNYFMKLTKKQSTELHISCRNLKIFNWNFYISYPTQIHSKISVKIYYKVEETEIRTFCIGMCVEKVCVEVESNVI